MKLVNGLVCVLLGTSISAFAGEGKTLHVSENVVINAPADKVWSKVENFNDLGAWHPAVKSTQLQVGDNNKPGAVRLLTLQDGGTIKEKLISYDAKKMNFKYSILEGVLPVKDYESVVSVQSEGANQSKVTWSGHFKAPAGTSDEDSAKTITSVYRGGLDNLKKISE